MVASFLWAEEGKSRADLMAEPCFSKGMVAGAGFEPATFGL